MATLRPALSSCELTEKLARLNKKKDFLSREKIAALAALHKEIKATEAARREAFVLERKIEAEKRASEALANAIELIPEIHAASLNLSKALIKFEAFAADAKAGEIVVDRSISTKFLPVVFQAISGNKLYMTNCLATPPPDCDGVKSRKLQSLIKAGGVSHAEK